MSNYIKDFLIIGSGDMAFEYSRVLDYLNLDYDVFGRGKSSALNFKKITGKEVNRGNFTEFINSKVDFYKYIIVAVSSDQLFNVTDSCFRLNPKKILVEKPAAFKLEELLSLKKSSQTQGVDLFVGYNRRFYSSVMKARKIVEKDGGLLSFKFDFTEWSHQLINEDIPSDILKKWFIVNSSHVIDLAFFLGGKVSKIESRVKSNLNWHPSGSIFVGSGSTNNGSLFSYHSNWESPGRWGIELFTKNRKIILCPLELISIQKLGQLESEEVNINDDWDKKFKPGLYLQIKGVLSSDTKLLSIEGQVENFKIFSKILGKKNENFIL